MQHLSPLLSELTSSDSFRLIRSVVARNGSAAVQGLSPTAKSFWSAALMEDRRPRPFLVVVPGEEDVKRILVELGAFGIEGIEPFPALEISPYEGISPDPGRHHQRQVALAGLRDGKLTGLVTTAKALLQVLPPVSTWEEAIVALEEGRSLAPAQLTQLLVRLGYRASPQVTEYGEFSRRGGLMDIFSPGNPLPLRLEWFGDQLESIRPFDPVTQRSLATVPAARLFPTRDLILPKAGWEAIARTVENSLGDRAGPSLQQKVRSDLEDLNVFHYPDGCEYYLPFVTPSPANLLDYLPPDSILVWDEPQRDRSHMQLLAGEWDQSYRAGVDRGEALPLPEPLHRPVERVERQAGRFARLDLYGLVETEERRTSDVGRRKRGASRPTSDLPTSALLTVTAPQADSFRGRIEDLVEALRDWYRRDRQRVLVVTAQPQRVLTILQEHDCPAFYGEPLQEGPGIWVGRGTLPRGFRYPDLRLIVLSDAELFGWRQRPVRKTVSARHPAGAPVTRLQDLRAGEYVIHVQHGIGQYLGLTQLTHGDTTREYLQIRYANEDKLYVPVEQMNLVSRYRGAEGQVPRLHKLGGVEWTNVRNRVRRTVKILAEDLLHLYAWRATREGFAFASDTEWQREMESAFPFRETPDQAVAILDTKSDMELPRPMDRLVCGDVGFGKTEVAIRAAFKAIMAGKQVAILVPTTILAQQHFDVFGERFAPYPIRVALLSRFRSRGEVREVTDGLRQGTVDLVIGTHRLLQKDVKFRDLGLLVIDEEHRFGVAHKERIKKTFPSADILSLSATPIPRTLNMALSGLRDLSLINTPPENRLPVKTRVLPYSREIIRSAILHELERGGQVFFVHNRIESLDRVAEDIREVVSGVRMGIGHGQLPEHELENLMLAFLEREFDVLLCTTIIESGLDIPSANTAIISNADTLGLAQLYQLRGRVGRSDVQAYAYCLYNPRRGLSEGARERLQALQDFTDLGSGYQISLRDMELRGIGNLLGAEQHGHMLAVGFDLYCQLLEEAVNELKAEEGWEVIPAAPRPADVLIDLDIPAFVPDTWLPDPRQKMTDYRRLAAMMAMDEVDRLEGEWKDRYGSPPSPARNLLEIVRLRVRATALDVTEIRMKGRVLQVSVPIPESEWAVLLQRFPLDLRRWQWSPVLLTTPRAALLPEDNLSLLSGVFNALEWARQELRV